MRQLRHAIALSLILCAGRAVAQADASYLRAAPGALRWWEESRFGVFICWGPVSIRGTEIGWSRNGPRPGHRSGHARSGVPVEEYDNLYRQFNPTQFDPREWTRVVKASGARYIIFLTKHHDGFCLFHTEYTDYSIEHTPFERDVTAELAAACQEEGIRILWYYSQPDWHHPDYRTENHDRYIAYLHGQIRELCTNYGRIDGIWFDGLGGRAEDWNSRELFRLIRELQPHAIINNRAGLRGDFDTPEQHVGAFRLDRPWESCITMQRSGWSWRPDQPLKSLAECLRLLVQCAGGGGNLALDIGPMPDGRINPEQAERLLQIGEWVEEYGESIYGTDGGPYRPGEWWGVSTRKANTVYLHILRWEDDSIRLPALPQRVVASRCLTGGTPTVEQTPDRLAVSLPAEHRDPVDTIVALTLEGSAGDIAPIASPEPDCISSGKPATASGIWSDEYAAEMAFDGDMRSRWGCTPDSRDGWIAVDLGEPTTFNRITIDEAPWNRVERFELQARRGGTWETFLTGTTLGEYRKRFPPVSARHVRLNILQANEVPTIWEIRLFAPEQ